MESPTDRKSIERPVDRRSAGQGAETWRVLLALLVAGVLYLVFGFLALFLLVAGMDSFDPASCGTLVPVECPQPGKGLLQIAGGVVGLFVPAVLAVYIVGTSRPRRTGVISACLSLATWAVLVGTAVGLAR
ncbi:hypothetical protein ACFVSK_04880 [Cellulosimicrobium cellulans]|uniref:hypothetical protein n=1 Tax=Cellulosimicrobium cellulans TaxID=1710 RepID=UPI0036E6112E